MDSWLPPSRENWELLTWAFQWFPLVTAIQWGVDWFPMGKTSVESLLNMPGKWAWLIMESPGFLTLLYIMSTLPGKLGVALPWQNWFMAGLFTVHYIYRAILSPLFLNPSMSPIHIFVMSMAASFQVVNGACIGGWLAGYGPTTAEDWSGRFRYVLAGTAIFIFGFIGNIYHEEILRDIRRLAAKEAEEKQKQHGEGRKSNGVQKVYKVPERGLFSVILYPHFVLEWIEWTGYWMIGGVSCVPARSFVLNELTTMVPQAVRGKGWYKKRFGEEKIGNRGALVPGII